MAEIHILDSDTIDKIAAGEVVERPASVVKELVENAIDAGASAITVEIKNGGIDMIRVTDNGCGIEPEQLTKAFMRHATSKIESADDLMQIHSLGFRGEALSSISAVSMVEMITKTKDNLIGTRVCVEGAVFKGMEEVGSPTGTTMIVRNLFYNVPARRKFLKSAATEGSYVSELMEHMALSRSDISFTYRLNGQLKFHTPGNHKMKDVIYMLYGKEMSQEVIAIDEQSARYHLYGFLGKPSIHRGNRNFELFFVNGRYIKSALLSKAVEEGGRGYYMQHKFPFCVLKLELAPDAMDVNVHPTKLEVRFTNQNALFDFIMDTVRLALRNHELIPEVSIGPTIKKEEKPIPRTAPEPFEQNRRRMNQNAGQSMEKETIAKENQRKADVEKTAAARVQVSATGHKHETLKPDEILFDRKGLNGKTEAQQAKQSLEALKTLTQNFSCEHFSDEHFPKEHKPEAEQRISTDTSKQEQTTASHAKEGLSNMEQAPYQQTEPGRSGEAQTNVKQDTFTFLGEISEEVSSHEELIGKAVPESGIKKPNPMEDLLPFVPVNFEKSEDTVRVDEEKKRMERLKEETRQEIANEKAIQLSMFEERMMQDKNRSKIQILGQIFKTYWLFSYEDALYILDQHAAHEKVNFERLMKSMKEKTVTSQQLNPPLILSLRAIEQEALQRFEQYFAAFGFEIEEFGGNEFAIRAIPQNLYGCDEKTFFENLLDDLVEYDGRGNPQVIYDKIASMACKAAVKGNQKMEFAEMEQLIEELLTLENPYHCPHGRPTMIKMTQYELDRKFKRIL